jgi:hypothetical protein
VRVVTGPTVVVVWLLTVVLTASFSLQLNEIGPAGPAPQVMENGLNTMVQVSLNRVPVGSVLVSMLRASVFVFWPVNAELGICPKTFVMVKLLKSAGSLVEEYCRLTVLPVPVATERVVELNPLAVEKRFKLAKAPSWVNFIREVWLAGTAGALPFGITCPYISAGNIITANTNSRFISTFSLPPMLGVPGMQNVRLPCIGPGGQAAF